MKTRKVTLRILAVLAGLYAIAYAARFQTTPPIEGVLVDAKSGKPVGKALVHANWHFSYSNLVDTTGGGFGYGTVTGEDGRFRIPRKNVTVVFGSFDDQSLIVKHPLYDFVDQQVYVQMYKKYRVGNVENGTLKLTLPIWSLEDRYSRPEDVNRFAYVVDDCGPDFYEMMRDKYNVRYDIDEIMAHLEGLARRYSVHKPEDSFAYRAFKTHEFLMSKFRKTY